MLRMLSCIFFFLALHLTTPPCSSLQNRYSRCLFRMWATCPPQKFITVDKDSHGHCFCHRSLDRDAIWPWKFTQNLSVKRQLSQIAAIVLNTIVCSLARADLLTLQADHQPGHHAQSHPLSNHRCWEFYPSLPPSLSQSYPPPSPLPPLLPPTPSSLPLPPPLPFPPSLLPSHSLHPTSSLSPAGTPISASP